MSEYMLSKDYFVQVIRDLIVLAEDRKEYFTDLDSAIGDGDHGINLASSRWNRGCWLRSSLSY